MWGARLPESAATLSPKAAFPTASLEADPKTLAGDALGRAVWGGLVELRLEVCRGTRSVAQPAACSVSIFGSSVEPREERRDLPASAPPVSMVKRSVAQQTAAPSHLNEFVGELSTDPFGGAPKHWQMMILVDIMGK